MHPRIEELLEYLDEERAKLRAVIDGIPRERLNKQPAPDRWSIAQVVDHLAVTEKRIAGLFRRLVADGRAAGIGAETETSSMIDALKLDTFVDRGRRLTSPAGVSPSGEPDSNVAWSALQDAREDFRTAILEADGLALAEISAPHPAFGPMNLYRWIGFIGAHEARHAQQILEIDASLAQNPA